MRDKRFVAEHRGGPLKKEQHRQLIKWAYGCVEHVLPLCEEKLDERLKDAVRIAKEWEKGNASVGAAMKASLNAHAVARVSSDPVSIAIARAAGHAAATAHMAEHSLAGALYSLKAVKNAGGSVDAERKWQMEQLPPEIRELVLTQFGRGKDQVGVGGEFGLDACPALADEQGVGVAAQLPAFLAAGRGG
jgi:hypothetical protein